MSPSNSNESKPLNGTNPHQQPKAEREVAQPVRFIKSGCVFRAFTWKERVKLFFGHNVVIETHLAMQHNPGCCVPMMKVHITPETNGEVAMKKVQESAKAEQKANGVKFADN